LRTSHNIQKYILSALAHTSAIYYRNNFIIPTSQLDVDRTAYISNRIIIQSSLCFSMHNATVDTWLETYVLVTILCVLATYLAAKNRLHFFLDLEFYLLWFAKDIVVNAVDGCVEDGLERSALMHRLPLLCIEVVSRFIGQIARSYKTCRMYLDQCFACY